VPWHKQEPEEPKPAADLFASDQGGLVYQPVVGLHPDVAEIDFISMYPGIMVRFNISPETAGPGRSDPLHLASLGPSGEPPGLIPLTLAPLLDKRLAFKAELAELPRWDPRSKSYKARAAAHKWLLVTCFGYLGYKNARFGRIEAHEAVTAYGREALLRAKEAAEDLGFEVLHLYVDGLWVRRPGARAVSDFQPVLDAIVERTGLPIALDGIYRWVAFLPSRVDPRVPVPNRYFGVFQDGSMKVRGIEARRRDAAAWVSETQLALLELLARAPEAAALPDYLPRALALLRREVARLRAGRVPLEKLVVNMRLSRALEEYRTPSPAARAAAQLQASLGRGLRAGQRVPLIFTRGDPGVHAWDLPETLPPARVDVERYTRLLLRAASAVLEPLGLDEPRLRLRVLANASAPELPLPGAHLLAGWEPAFGLPHAVGRGV
jgi:DNA polymerase-2